MPDAPSELPASGSPPRTESARSPATDVRFALGVVLVAVLAGAFAIAFRGALTAAYRAMAGANDVVSVMRAFPPLARFLVPALGGLAAGAIGLLASRRERGHGVGDVMEAVVLGRVRLSLRSTTLKSLASWSAIVCGGSVGREGPLIQFGGASGRWVSDRLGLGLVQARMLIAAGTAAGFAAAYNTPFAAVLFVLEVVTGMVVLDAILPALVATAIATVMTRAVVGEGPIYGAHAFRLRGPVELLAFALLGLVTAVAAQGFMRLLSLGERGFHRSRIPLPWRPALGGLLTGALIVAIPEVAGNGYEPLHVLLDGRILALAAFGLLAGKLLATTATVSSGSPGGVFTPTLLVGGTVGYLCARGLLALGIPVGAPGGYVLVGMAAATAATTHAPLTAAVMAFELSGDYAIALPLVLATALATLVSRRMRRESIYTAELKARGLDWEVTFEGRRPSG